MGDGAPGRVVSLNVCTDQLALLLGAPGQLVSVSRLAHDPRSSAMAREAASFPANHAHAEEIALLDISVIWQEWEIEQIILASAASYRSQTVPIDLHWKIMSRIAD